MADSTFACLAFLEDETCQLLEIMIKNSNTETGLLLDIILQETRKHRELLRHLSTVYEHDALPVSECENEMGEWFKQAVRLVHTVKGEVLRGMPVQDAARKLIELETGAGEEYLTASHARIKNLTEQNQAVKMILDNIAADEEGHAEILQRLVTKTSSKK